MNNGIRPHTLSTSLCWRCEKLSSHSPGRGRLRCPDPVARDWRGLHECGLLCSSVHCCGVGVARRDGGDTARRREEWREATTPLHARVHVRATLTGVRTRGTLFAALDADAVSALAFNQLAAPACVARTVHALELNSLEVAVGGLRDLSVQA
jgi:hypothetical protein